MRLGRNGLALTSRRRITLGSRLMMEFGAAIEAIKDYGPHVRCAVCRETPSSLRWQRLSRTDRTPHVVLFPTGWAAGYGVITALIRTQDHVVLDQSPTIAASGSDGCDSQCASGAAPVDRRIRTAAPSHPGGRREECDPVVAEGISSMDGDSPDMQTLRRLPGV